MPDGQLSVQSSYPLRLIIVAEILPPDSFLENFCFFLEWVRLLDTLIVVVVAAAAATRAAVVVEVVVAAAAAVVVVVVAVAVAAAAGQQY